MSEPLKKRLWQEIVKAKINNQAMCLEIFNCANFQNCGKFRSLSNPEM